MKLASSSRLWMERAIIKQHGESRWEGPGQGIGIMFIADHTCAIVQDVCDIVALLCGRSFSPLLSNGRSHDSDDFSPTKMLRKEASALHSFWTMEAPKDPDVVSEDASRWPDLASVQMMQGLVFPPREMTFIVGLQYVQCKKSEWEGKKRKWESAKGTYSFCNPSKILLFPRSTTLGTLDSRSTIPSRTDIFLGTWTKHTWIKNNISSKKKIELLWLTDSESSSCALYVNQSGDSRASLIGANWWGINSNLVNSSKQRDPAKDPQQERFFPSIVLSDLQQPSSAHQSVSERTDKK